MTSVADGDEFSLATNFIAKLKGIGSSSRRRLVRSLYSSGEPDFRKQIIVVPGNHDVQWTENRRTHKKALDAFKNFIVPSEVLSPLSEPPAVYIEPVNLTILACNSAHLGGVDVPANFPSLPPELQRSGGESFGTLMNQMRDIILNLASGSRNAEQEMSDAELLDCIIRFTWGYVDPDFLANVKNYIGLSRTQCKIEKPKGSTHSVPELEVRIGVLHHNISFFGEGSVFTDLVNTKRVTDTFVENNVNLILHGHQHQFNITGEKFYLRRRPTVDFVLANTLHCVGVDSLGVPGPGGRPAFNEIKVLPKSKYEGARSVEVRRVEISVVNGNLGPAGTGGRAELIVEKPEIVQRDADQPETAKHA
jgi:hypothetical protein